MNKYIHMNSKTLLMKNSNELRTADYSLRYVYSFFVNFQDDIRPTICLAVYIMPKLGYITKLSK